MVQFKRIIFILCFSLFVAKDVCASTFCFIVAEGDRILKKEGDCEKRWSPCSTFKITISLMGYETGILIDELRPLWNYKSGYVDWLDRWKRPHNPILWFKNSCIWYSQIITEKLGIDRFANYIDKFAYGNQNISGDKGKKNGLTNAWLSSSLKISPIEQVEFLQKLIKNILPVSIKSHEMTKKIMFIENLQNGWKLYGKTGSGYQLSKDKLKKTDKQIGWFIGFIQKENRSIAFACFVADDQHRGSFASFRARMAANKELDKIMSSEEIQNSAYEDL